MEAISKLSKKYGFRIIEDASHAIGGEYLNKKSTNVIPPSNKEKITEQPVKNEKTEIVNTEEN